MIAPTSAANLANELAAELTVTENERDEAIRERDEAQAVTDAVRKVRATVATKRRMHYDRWNESDNAEDGAKAAAYGDALDLLDAVDGL